jgi:hypothetical protein
MKPLKTKDAFAVFMSARGQNETRESFLRKSVQKLRAISTENQAVRSMSWRMVEWFRIENRMIAILAIDLIS